LCITQKWAQIEKGKYSNTINGIFDVSHRQMFAYLGNYIICFQVLNTIYVNQSQFIAEFKTTLIKKAAL